MSACGVVSLETLIASTGWVCRYHYEKGLGAARRGNLDLALAEKARADLSWDILNHVWAFHTEKGSDDCERVLAAMEEYRRLVSELNEECLDLKYGKVDE